MEHQQDDVHTILEEMKRVQDIRADVRERYPTVKFPDVYKEPIWIGRTRDDIEVQKDSVAICGSLQEDQSDRIRYAYASNQYKIVTHEEAVLSIETALKDMPEFGQPEIVVSLLNTGALMRTRVTFPEAKYEVREGEPVNPQANLFNSYDMSKRLLSQFGARELVCSNGLIAFKVRSSIGQKHRLNIDVGYITSEITSGMQQFSEQVGLWSNWAKKELKEPDWIEVWDALPFGGKKNELGEQTGRYREQLLDYPRKLDRKTIRGMLTDGSVNVWDAHSIITQFITHEIESENVQIKTTRDVARIFHNINVN
jgi:hypothetical protein